MKNILSILIIVTTISCKAQIITYSIGDWYEGIPNAYYKDLNNELDAFEGTWLYSNGNTTLKIILRKEVMYFNGRYYEDLIVGEYQYIKDGVELINTLSNINNPNAYEHKIRGQNLYYDCYFLPVSDCADGEVRLHVDIFDANVNGYAGDLILHKRNINGQDALRAYFGMGYVGGVPQDSTIPDSTFNLTQDELIFIKQN